MHLASCLVAIFVVACGSPVTPKTELVLQAFPTAKQFGEAGWFLSGGGRDDYLVERDGDGWRLSPHASTYGKYGTFMRNVDATLLTAASACASRSKRARKARRSARTCGRAVQAATSPTDGSGLVVAAGSISRSAPDGAPYVCFRLRRAERRRMDSIRRRHRRTRRDVDAEARRSIIVGRSKRSPLTGAAHKRSHDRTRRVAR